MSSRRYRVCIAEKEERIHGILEDWCPPGGVLEIADHGPEIAPLLRRSRELQAVLLLSTDLFDEFLQGASPEQAEALPAAILIYHQAEVDLLLRGWNAGLRGFLSFDGLYSRLLEALRRLSEGGAFADSAAALSLLDARNVPDITITRREENPLEKLTGREWDVLRELLRGVKKAEVARRLSISSKTLESHQSRLYRKLGVRNLVQLYRVYMRYNAREER